MKKIVFAGPSLLPGDHGRYGEIEFRPPARKGDLVLAAEEGAGVIGLVDGLFELQPAVWHKEILHCLNRGIVVAGAASMGALRAAECARFGMIGIGAIFEEYRRGARTSDADVAVLHAPAALGYTALTLALADAEATIRRMLAAGAVGEATADALQSVARSIHFKDRSWEAIRQRLSQMGLEVGDLGTMVRAHRVEQKHEDCIDLLDFVRDFDPAHKPANARPVFALQNTAFLTGLIRAVTGTRNSRA